MMKRLLTFEHMNKEQMRHFMTMYFTIFNHKNSWPFYSNRYNICPMKFCTLYEAHLVH